MARKKLYTPILSIALTTFALAIPKDPLEGPHDDWMSAEKRMSTDSFLGIHNGKIKLNHSKNNISKIIDNLVDKKLSHSTCTDDQKNKLKSLLQDGISRITPEESSIYKEIILNNAEKIIEEYKNSEVICQFNATNENNEINSSNRFILQSLKDKLGPIWPFL